MLRRIPKLLLLVALLTALAASSIQALGRGHCGREFCSASLEATYCLIDKNGNCSTHACEPGQPCQSTACGGFCVP